MNRQTPMSSGSRCQGHGAAGRNQASIKALAHTGYREPRVKSTGKPVCINAPHVRRQVTGGLGDPGCRIADRIALDRTHPLRWGHSLVPMKPFSMHFNVTLGRPSAGRLWRCQSCQ